MYAKHFNSQLMFTPYRIVYRVRIARRYPVSAYVLHAQIQTQPHTRERAHALKRNTKTHTKHSHTHAFIYIYLYIRTQTHMYANVCILCIYTHFKYICIPT